MTGAGGRDRAWTYLLYVVAVAVAIMIAGFLVDRFAGPTASVEVRISDLSRNQHVQDGVTRYEHSATAVGGETFEITSSEFDELDVGSTYSCEAEGFGFWFFRRDLSDCEPATASPPDAPADPGEEAPEEELPTPREAQRCIERELGTGEFAYSSVHLPDAFAACLPPVQAQLELEVCVLRSSQAARQAIERCLPRVLKSFEE